MLNVRLWGAVLAAIVAISALMFMRQAPGLAIAFAPAISGAMPLLLLSMFTARKRSRRQILAAFCALFAGLTIMSAGIAFPLRPAAGFFLLIYAAAATWLAIVAIRLSRRPPRRSTFSVYFSDSRDN